MSHGCIFLCTVCPGWSGLPSTLCGKQCAPCWLPLDTGLVSPRRPPHALAVGWFLGVMCRPVVWAHHDSCGHHLVLRVQSWAVDQSSFTCYTWLCEDRFWFDFCTRP